MQLFAKSPERSSKSWFSEIARVLVRFDHVARIAVNANDNMM